MGKLQFDRPNIEIRSLSWLLVGALTLAVLLGLAATRPSGTLADGGTNCDQADLQTALNTQSIVAFDPGCTIYLTSGLTVPGNATVSIEGDGLILSGATAANPTTAGSFDLISVGAGAKLTIYQTTLEYANRGISAADGVSNVSLFLMDSTVTEMGNDGIHFNGSANTLKLLNSSITNSNESGIYSSGSNVVVLYSSIVGNHYYGIDANNIDATTTTIADNAGGGIFAGGTVTLTGSSVIGNESYGVVSLDITLQASLLSGNATASCSNYFATVDFIDNGYNLATDSSCEFAANSTSKVVTSAALNLLPLGNYGGPTPTVALGPNSVAIDYIPAEPCYATLDPVTLDPIATDQRGVTRLQGAACDVGAYEAPSLQLWLGNQIQGGWYTTSQPVSLTYAGLAPAQTVSCRDISGQVGSSLTATNLNQGGSFDPMIPDGSYSLSCGISQGATLLGVSYSGPTQPLDLKIDTTPPDVQCSPSSSTNWTNHNITVDCTASDPASGLADSTLASFTLSTSVPANSYDAAAPTGSQTVCDKANNCTTAGPFSFAVDLKDPSVSCGIPTAPANGWFTSKVTVTCSASDVGSGLASINYTLDGQATSVTGKTKFTVAVSADGAHTFSYSATDEADNTTTPQSLSFKIDATDPTASITSPTDKAVFLVGQTDGIGVTFSCTDPQASDGATGSGIATTGGCAGSLDGTAITSATALDTSAAAIGPHTLKVTATDQAGNTGNQTVTYQVEALAAPAITVNGGTSYTGDGYWYNLSNSPSGVTVTVSDSNSLVTGYACTDNGSPFSLTLSNDTPPSGIADLEEGIHHLSCTASASSTSTSSSATTAMVQVDLTRPVITSPVASRQYILNASVPLSCADPNGVDNATGSGIASCQVTVTLPDGTTQTVTTPDGLPTSELGSYTVTPKLVTDKAGNDDTTSFSYTVAYQLVPLPGNIATVNHGYFALIRFAPEDVNGVDYASRTLTATTVELNGPNGQVIRFVHQFQFTMAHNLGEYQLELNTRNLAVGTWTLKVQITGAATVYAVMVTIN